MGLRIESTWGNTKVLTEITDKQSRDYQVTCTFTAGGHGFRFLFTVYRHRLKQYTVPQLTRAWQLYQDQVVEELPSSPRRLANKIPKGMYGHALKLATNIMKQEHDQAKQRQQEFDRTKRQQSSVMVEQVFRTVEARTR